MADCNTHKVFNKESGELEGYIFTSDNNFLYGKIIFENGEIIDVDYFSPNSALPAVLPYDDARRAILGERIAAPVILPGLVDVHLHGANGFDICDATSDSIAGICEYERKSGIAAFIGATMTLPKEKLEEVCRAVAEVSLGTDPGMPEVSLGTDLGMPLGTDSCKKRDPLGTDPNGKGRFAGFEGLFLEGPFVSKNKCGAQNPEYAILPDADLVQNLNGLSGGMVRKVLVAPELVGAEEFVRQLKDTGDRSTESKLMSTEIKITLGHTDCDYESAMKLIAVGADQITHTYNAMPAFDKRNPGLIGAALDGNCYTELISDGIHVHESVIRATFNMVPEDKIVLISDSTMATGLPDGDATLGGTPVKVVTKNERIQCCCDSRNCDEAVRRVELSTGTIAGSATNLFDCMLHAIKIGVPVSKAIRAATINPARSIGIDDRYGTIDEGKSAFFNVFFN